MLIQITNRCHMMCPHCLQDSGPQGRHMSEDTFGQVLDFCREAGPWTVNVTGGEPTEHPRWAEMVRELLRLSPVSLVIILTNGASWASPKTISS